MRITLINPNTSRAMTAKIADAAREVAGPDVEIVAVCPADGEGPAAVESHYDEVRAAAAIADIVLRDQEAGGSDGYVIACFGDPGLDAARELVDVPVVGIAEAAMHVAALTGRSFGIVTTLSRTLGRAEDLVLRYGFERACVAAYGTGIPVLELEDTGSAAFDQIAGWCERVVREDGADAIVLGCAGMADLCARLSAIVGVPVVDGVAASVGLVSAMARMGAGTSKRDEYATPPRVPSPGRAQRRRTGTPVSEKTRDSAASGEAGGDGGSGSPASCTAAAETSGTRSADSVVA
ncbi:aspartate/glutamate racemase family protein [Microbacterium betulae]|uniref:Aspartate/glutamate racemase family protein n=1 Tax=Microbacterium betulae TaxID=2981139 RepID=A0AA97FJN5_9MICO|nr:aspartate/glutamate racemase family protein [Microbacterium sp. AB]WOF22762.1 aspartate/glutamate racemase family protein [Microbacterium sp. AB]